MKQILILFTLFSSITLLGFSQTFTSARNGDYSDNNTWAGSTAPNKTISAGMNVIINHDVVMDEDVDVVGGSLIINPSGTFTGNKELKVESGGNFTADGLVTLKKLDVEDGGTSVTINDSIYVDGDVKIKNGASLTLNGNSVFDKKFDIEDNSTFVANGTLLVDDEFNIKDNGNVTLNGVFRTNTKLKVEDNATMAINANAFIDGDAEFKDNVNITVGPNSIVQITDELKNKDDSELTINGAVAAANGKENKDNGIINGTGLLQVDGGFNNEGTITGSLNICQSNASSNPITSGNAAQGGIDICNLGPDPNNSIFPLIPAAPLPISLIDFDAALNENDQVELIWVTEGELNNDYFTIERSDENLNFVAIEYIPGAGTTNETKEYKYTDKEPIKGKSYYRLKQTDFDGKSKSFDLVSVQITQEEKGNEINIYPNPSNGLENIYLKIPNHIDETYNILISDLHGREFVSSFITIKLNSQPQIVISPQGVLPKGLYLINIFNHKVLITKKLIVK